MDPVHEIIDALAEAHDNGLGGIYLDDDTGQLIDISNIPDVLEIDHEQFLAEILALIPSDIE